MRPTEHARPTRRWPGPAILLATIALAGASSAAAAAERAAAPGAWLGVWSANAVDGGAQILAVVRDGPAAQAGLRGGDVVVELAGRPVAGEADLGRALRELAPGDKARIGVLRDGERLELEARLGERVRRDVLALPPAAPESPDAPPTPPAPRPSGMGLAGTSLARAGLSVVDIGPALRAHYGAPADAGVLVTRVEDGAAAATAGIVVGDVLVRIGEMPIRSEREVRGNLVRWTSTEPVRVEIVRSGEPRVITLTPERLSARPAGGAERTRERLLEAEIERLSRRLEELERELARLRSGE